VKDRLIPPVVFFVHCQVQHLKTKYLDGYVIDVNCLSGTLESTIDTVVDSIIHELLPGSKVYERHGRFLRFELSSVSSLGLGTIFGRLQALKDENEELRVEDYSISQCSLEQVFLKMVRHGDPVPTNPTSTAPQIEAD